MKKQRGITLIALVITIIVMLILAGVTISSITGDNGILTRADNAKDEHQMAAEKEQATLAYGAAKIANEGQGATIEDLQEELDNSVGAGKTRVTEGENGKLNVLFIDSGNSFDIGVAISNWETTLEKANADPESFKHPDQVSSSYIAIGTDEKPVNMDLWNPTLLSNGSWGLGEEDTYSTSNIYIGDIKNGKIEGKMPQYIYNSSQNRFTPVTLLHGTFYCLEELTVDPGIPDTVESLYGTFLRTNLESVIIPSSVEQIKHATFDNCKIKELKIPSSVKVFGGTLAWGCHDLEKVYFEHTQPPTFEERCFYIENGEMITFYFKNGTVANSFTEEHYDSSLGTKSTDYNW